MKSTFTRARILLIILISYTWINEILEILLKLKFGTWWKLIKIIKKLENIEISKSTS